MARHPEQSDSKPRISVVTRVLVGAFIVVILFSLLLPGTRSGPPSPLGDCQFNMSRIAIAMGQYHDDYGCFPPAYVADEDGRPLHSWRVLLLPYLAQAGFHPEYNRVYSEYNFDEPWNGPHNILLLEQTPSMYRCPGEGEDESPFTSYVAIVGPGAVFDRDHSNSLSDLDVPELTIMIAEISGSDILWTEPRDLSSAEMTFRVNGGANDISSSHEGGANVVFCTRQITHSENGTVDFGGVGFLTDETSPAWLKGRCTLSGADSGLQSSSTSSPPD